MDADKLKTQQLMCLSKCAPPSFAFHTDCLPAGKQKPPMRLVKPEKEASRIQPSNLVPRLQILHIHMENMFGEISWSGATESTELLKSEMKAVEVSAECHWS